MFRLIHLLLVKLRVLPIPKGWRIEVQGYTGKVIYHEWWGCYFKIDHGFGSGTAHIHRSSVRVLGPPIRLSKFEQQVQSYIDQELAR